MACDELAVYARGMKRILLAGVIAFALTGAAPRGPEIHTEDVTRFYAVYDAAGGTPTATQIQQDYLDKGTAGLAEFARLRRFSGERIAAAIAERPTLYADARRCAAVLPAVKTRLAPMLAKLGTLYPAAIFPPVTVAVGRGRTAGTANASGVMVGLESLCAVDYFNPDMEERFVHLIGHEYVHVQQPGAQVEDPNETVLRAAVMEGGAEFIGELMTGSVSYINLHEWARGREAEVERAFVAEQDQTALKSRWIYNGRGTAEWPGDLGYWVGYRIVKAYYQQARDKQAAVRDIIKMRDPKAFLAQSGWRPGMRLD
ncbi:Predicted Zn-dependent protease [Sphingomonas laterariae]|uniref:Predicted Zn-dependent protease n=2 Tax=Edaphosphingomonas laterariae TaxID=861865 RepID=A0A239J2W3_9SPHN|nr:Predicted Zn-dependent protease [Sphingomonas laterariae]